MKTFELNDLYDYQFQQPGTNAEYSNFLGFVKDLFPAHTIVGKALGSNNHGKGIELGGLIGLAGGNATKSPKQTHYVHTPVKKDDDLKKYVIIGGVVLLAMIVGMFYYFSQKK